MLWIINAAEAQLPLVIPIANIIWDKVVVGVRGSCRDWPVLADHPIMSKFCLLGLIGLVVLVARGALPNLDDLLHVLSSGRERRLGRDDDQIAALLLVDPAISGWRGRRQ